MEKPVPVPAGSFVVMTSDGFDFPKATVAETRAAKLTAYKRDTLRIGLDHQTFVSFRT